MKDFSGRIESLETWDLLKHGDIVYRQVEVDFALRLACKLSKLFVSNALKEGLADVCGTDIPLANRSLRDNDFLGQF